jgi:hypothetical protein
MTAAESLLTEQERLMGCQLSGVMGWDGVGNTVAIPIRNDQIIKLPPRRAA